MRYQAILFDLDGTLADTLADIAAAANYALTMLERPTQQVERYRLMVGRASVPAARAERRSRWRG